MLEYQKDTLLESDSNSPSFNFQTVKKQLSFTSQDVGRVELDLHLQKHIYDSRRTDDSCDCAEFVKHYTHVRITDDPIHFHSAHIASQCLLILITAQKCWNLYNY